MRRLEVEDVGGVFCKARVLAARVHDDEVGAACCRLLQVCRRNRVVLRWPSADDNYRLGVPGGRERSRHRARVDTFHQRRHRGGVAQARTMVDVVGAEALPDQLLEQIGFLVGTLCRAQARERGRPPCVAQPLEALGRHVERLIPCRLAEDLHDLVTSTRNKAFALGLSLAPDQRLRQPVRMVDIVEAEPALYA